MVPLGQPLPTSPSPEHKQGLRMCVKLSSDIGGDVRELSGNSSAFLTGIDALHTEYEAGKVSNVGKLPVVALADTLAIESKGQGQKSTNYRPVFQIIAWVDRPKDLVASPRGSTEPKAIPNWATPAQPPATGNVRAVAPVGRTPEPISNDLDFG